MTEVTFYKNGFVINKHTQSDICSELSMFAWVVSNIILNIEQIGEYVTDEKEGYGHFVFNHENSNLVHIFSIAKQMLPMWAEKYKWDDYVKIVEVNEVFLPN